jgi:hypothetical protein
MTLEKAIKELEHHSELILIERNPVLKKAVKLGIEALKLIARNRRYTPQPYAVKLPGETEE